MHTSGASRRENASARPLGCLKIESEITPKWQAFAESMLPAGLPT